MMSKNIEPSPTNLHVCPSFHPFIEVMGKDNRMDTINADLPRSAFAIILAETI